MTAPPPATSPAADLAALREQREALAIQREIAELSAYTSGINQLNSLIPGTPLYESVHNQGYGEGFGAYVGNNPLLSDPSWHYAYDDGGQPIDLVGDREHGKDRPVFQNEIDLARIRGVARWICAYNPAGIGVMRSLVNYVIGTEWSYEASPVDSDDQPLADSVSAFVEDWIEHNAFVGMRDREIYRRMVRDGAGLSVLTPEQDRRDGMTRCRIEEDSHITEPDLTRDLEHYIARQYRIPVDQFASDWGFGVHTPVDDHERIFGFHVVRDAEGRDWDYIPEQHAEYFRSSAGDRNVKRGVSEFWPVEKHLRKGDKVFTATADGSAIQARIAWIRELGEGHQRATISPVDQQIVIPQQGGTRQANAVHYPTPISLTVPNGQKYHPGPMGSQRNPNLIMAGQAVLRLAGVRWSMPEWIPSGDASNNNFASSLTAESPFVKSVGAEQFSFRRHAISLLWKAIRFAHAAGRFGNVAWAELRKRIKLTGTPPSIATRDPLQKSQQDEIQIRNGVKSRRTAAQEDGLDFDAEVASMTDDNDAAFRQQQQPASPAEIGALAGALQTAESMDDVRAISESMLRRYP